MIVNSDHSDVSGTEQIAQFVRDCDPLLADTPDLSEKISEMVLHPLFLPLLMYFSNEVDTEHFRNQQKMRGASGGKAASDNRESAREAARTCFLDKAKRFQKSKVIAEMIIASNLGTTTCTKIFNEEEAKRLKAARVK